MSLTNSTISEKFSWNFREFVDLIHDYESLFLRKNLKLHHLRNFIAAKNLEEVIRKKMLLISFCFFENV